MQKTVVRIMALLLVALMCLTLLPIRSWAYELDPSECKDHTFVFERTENAWISDATCTQAAMYHKTCSKCGTVSETEVVYDGEPLGHNFGEWGNNTATCKAGGTETRACSRCEATETRETSALVHDYSVHHDAVAATCTEAGSTEYYTCSRCGDQDPAHPMTTVPATGHTWVMNPSSDYLKKAATCTEKASYYQSCETCGAESDSMYFDYGEPLGHDWQDHARVEPTCAQDGTEAYKECSRCGLKDPENAPVSIDATGNHSWKTVVDDKYWKADATCTEKAQYYQSCETCGAKSPDRYFETGDPLGHHWTDGVCDRCDAVCDHSFDEDDVCTTCGIHKYSFTVTLGSNGSATWNGNAVSSGTAVKVLEGSSVEIILTPANGYVVDTVSVSGGSTVTGSNTVAFTMNAANNGLTVSCTFKQGTVDKTPVAVVTKASLPSMNAVNSVIANLASSRNVSTSQIAAFGYDVTPYWDGDTSDPVDSADITTPLTFTIPYPSGYSSADYVFFVYHYDAASDSMTELPAASGSSGVISSSAVFSRFALFAAPKSSSKIIITRADQKAPTGLTVTDRIDNGTRMAGSISGLTTAMEYKLKDGTEGYYSVTGSTLSNLAAGTYLVRYAGSSTLNPSPATEVTINDWYTVTAQLMYGKGTYYTDCPKYGDYDNVFLVQKWDSIKFTFTPQNGYWLHEININGRYVGSRNVTNPFTINGVKGPITVSFGFSGSTSSPKTADNSMTFEWVVMAIGTFFGMTTITWYLFRRKEF